MEPLALHRRMWLSAILLLVLGLSILGAWWLVELRRVPAVRGEEILIRIRNQGLGYYWGSRPATHWYLVQDPNGRALGYVVRARWPSRDGYSGMALYRAGDAHHWENWSLDSTADSGVYIATVGGRGLPDTQIVLKDGRVTVLKPRAAGSERAVQSAPPGYIPEGLMYLVIGQMAKATGDTRFRFVYNPESIVGAQVHFATVAMSPRGQGKVRVRSYLFAGTADDLYHLDAKGEVYRIDDHVSGATTRLTDLRTLAGEFPEVLDLQRELESGTEETGGDLGARGPDLPPSRGPHQAAL